MINKKIVVFGAGSSGKKIAKILNDNFECYLDNDKQKIGKKIRGKLVENPSKFLNKKRDLYILIASVYALEIAEQLDELGFVESQDYIVADPYNLYESELNTLLKRVFHEARERSILYSSYEPFEIGGELIDDSRRDWKKRWKSISEEIKNYSVSSVIDIGCAEGWFVRRAAEDHDCFTIGVEFDYTRLLPGEISRLHDGVEKCAVMKAKLNPEDILKLPVFDMAICLSVVHHIIYSNSLESAKEFVYAISRRVNKAIVFEMGTSEEVNMKWADQLPAMKQGQQSFIKEFLQSSGFKNVRVIGETLSIEMEAKRLLFIAEPDF